MKYLIFSILLIACRTSSKEPDKNLDNSDSIIKVAKDIPIDENGKYLYYYSLKSIYEKKLGLISLEDGFDSLEIRIHYGVALAYEEQTIILQKNNSGWNGKLYQVKFNSYPMDDSLFSITMQEKDVKPKSGWNNLMNNLYDLDILTLRDAHELSNYEGCQDGDGVLIEIATKTKYRIYQYPCFSYVLGTENIWQYKNIETILKRLGRELDFKRVTLTP